MTELAAARMTLAELEEFLERDFPQMNAGGKSHFVDAIGDRFARIRMSYHERHLRPGGTISGPSMFALADFALYCAILASIGPVALAVTTSMNMNFLRKPAQRDLFGEARLLKLGRRLAVGEVMLRSEGEEELVAHATGTYSIPPDR
ncbi:PaaI family thioesterase [Terrarubrum flagellatum]|uniref:PaaI family thioesterase n=1 Tax=Terrirubrum flagellatum TaxID=2895980 RepID=UPI003144E449